MEAEKANLSLAKRSQASLPSSAQVPSHGVDKFVRLLAYLCIKSSLSRLKQTECDISVERDSPTLIIHFQPR